MIFFERNENKNKLLKNYQQGVFEFFQNFISKNNIEADFWLIPDAYHVDAMLKYPNEYSQKMKQFFEENLK